jgi:hypothetical protein
MRLFLAVLFCLAAWPAWAETLKGGYPVCVSKGLLDQMDNAILKADMRAMDYLFDHGCLESKAGLPVSVIESSWGAAHIRIYAGNSAAEAWASMGAIGHP